MRKEYEERVKQVYELLLAHEMNGSPLGWWEKNGRIDPDRITNLARAALDLGEPEEIGPPPNKNRRLKNLKRELDYISSGGLYKDLHRFCLIHTGLNDYQKSREANALLKNVAVLASELRKLADTIPEQIRAELRGINNDRYQLLKWIATLMRYTGEPFTFARLYEHAEQITGLWPERRITAETMRAYVDKSDFKADLLYDPDKYWDAEKEADKKS